MIVYEHYLLEKNNYSTITSASLSGVNKKKKWITICYRITFYLLLKGQCHEIFDLRFFTSNNTPWAPDSRTKAFFNSASNLPRYDRFSNAKIVHVVSMTPHGHVHFAYDFYFLKLFENFIVQ
jgi:hypothetical protein